MTELVNPNDKYKMNWIEGNVEWGTVICSNGLEVSVTRDQTDSMICERYTFKNVSGVDVFTSLKDIGIYTPFNDNYTDAKICLTGRCHTHIFCGENVSYVMALRMNGEGEHLGLVLTEGSLGGYSVERDLEQISNDRGDFILHPSPVILAPDESFTVAWTLFWHNGKQDFYKKARQYNPNFIQVTADNFTLYDGEAINLKITPSYKFCESDVCIKANGIDVKFEIENQQIVIKQIPSALGEVKFDIYIKGIKTNCSFIVLPKFEELLERRCDFIVTKQQYHNAKSGLDGAFLAYDNEEEHIRYKTDCDHNGGRERVGMGVLLAKYLQSHKNEKFENALAKYITYVERELFDTKTGEVFNDYNRNNTYPRMYNYAWFCLFYVELYKLYGKREYLLYAWRILDYFYAQNGKTFYALPIPMTELLALLEKENFKCEKDMLFNNFLEHSDYILNKGLEYPPHEVKFEQATAFSATHILLQMYEITKCEKYLNGAKLNLDALELFTSHSPDYHLYEVAIRHWDGFWFGKREMYGDTFPHYWSSLNGVAYELYARLAEDDEYMHKADCSFRGSMSLFFADGRASCACLYPVTVNGQDSKFFDPLANDQDWAMYFMLCYKKR